MTTEKLISIRLMKCFPVYIEKNYGPDAAIEYLKRTGLTSEQLNDPDLWITWEQYIRMIDELVKFTGDQSSPFEAGKYASAPTILHEAWHLIFANLVDMKTMFRTLVKINPMYNRTADWEIIELTRTCVRLRIKWRHGIRTTKASCLNRQGMIGATTTMFGMPQAKSKELQCQSDGYDSCVEEYEWRNRPRRVFTPALTVAGAVVAAAITGLSHAAVDQWFFAASIVLIAFLTGFVIDNAKIMAASNRINAEQNKEMEGLVKRLEDRYEELKKTTEEKQKIERELYKTRQVESLGVLAGGIAHDFNNILGTILSHVSVAKLNLAAPDKAMRHLEAAEKGFIMAKRLTGQMLTFSKGGAPVKEAISLKELITDSADFALRGWNTRCEYSIPDDLWTIVADDAQISQVISNLVINACQSMPDGHRAIRIRAENASLETGEAVHISIEDNGTGILPENLEKIFNPFYTTKPSGSGLGLSIADSIIKKHDGRITVESRPGKTIFHIYLPALEYAAQEKAYVKERNVIYKGAGKVLVMDDDKAFSNAIREGLMELGYTADVTPDGAEAIDKYRNANETGARYDAVIIDLAGKGGLSGQETMQRILEIDPGAVGIISSGYSNEPVMSNYGGYGFKAMLVKPYSISKLSETLHKLVKT
ncbi:MAG: response regulator [Deltaproteobacteria bacterium]|nr:response regulator [Deltaproteobacteria bacterium]